MNIIILFNIYWETMHIRYRYIIFVCTVVFGILIWNRKLIGVPVRSNEVTYAATKMLSSFPLDLKSESGQSNNHDKLCENGPKKNVMYLKTHKTGSSTLQGVLARKAFKDNSFVGILDPRYSETGKKFTASDLMPVPPNRTLRMMIKEIVFDYQEVSAIMPADTIYITTIREPAKHFESSFHYLYRRVDAYQRAKTKNPKLDYLINADKYYQGVSDKGPEKYWWFGKNPLFFELGYDNVNHDDKYIEEAISEIDTHFDLVMIMEYFDISVLLFMDILCWNMEDLLFITLNARNPSTVEKISSDLSEKIYAWNKADAALYTHFNSTFWKRVEKYGINRMEENLIRFREMKQKVFEHCYENNTINRQRGYNVKYKPLSMAHYQIKRNAKRNRTCTDMIIEGWDWYNKIKKLEYN